MDLGDRGVNALGHPCACEHKHPGVDAARIDESLSPGQNSLQRERDLYEQEVRACSPSKWTTGARRGPDMEVGITLEERARAKRLHFFDHSADRQVLSAPALFRRIAINE